MSCLLKRNVGIVNWDNYDVEAKIPKKRSIRAAQNWPTILLDSQHQARGWCKRVDRATMEKEAFKRRPDAGRGALKLLPYELKRERDVKKNETIDSFSAWIRRQQYTLLQCICHSRGLSPVSEPSALARPCMTFASKTLSR